VKKSDDHIFSLPALHILGYLMARSCKCLHNLDPGMIFDAKLERMFCMREKIGKSILDCFRQLDLMDQPLASSFGLQLPKADAISTSCVKAKNI